ncbi:MAG: hypothetical protein FWF81_03765 [Defluviitaleaceae bacterium]|nr:hypothetical protein [Defluviitaleaceae bacterium]
MNITTNKDFAYQMLDTQKKKIHYKRLINGLNFDLALQGVPILKGVDLRDLGTAIAGEDTDDAKTAILQLASIIERRARADERKNQSQHRVNQKLHDDVFLQKIRDELGLRY